LLGSLLPGCLSFHRERPVAIMVRDAETKQPLPAADVHLSYRARPSEAPAESSETTKTDGIARLTTTPNGKDPLVIRASAQGYMTESIVKSDEVVEQIEPAGWFESVNRRPVNFILEVYKGPPFSVELAVATGYRGLVKAELRIQDNLSCAPGERRFQYMVEPNGNVIIAGPAQLRHVNPADYQAHYVDGTVLGNHIDVNQVGWRWLKHEGNFEYFVIGTKGDLEMWRRQLFPNEPSAPAETTGRRGGGGRGGRGGGGGGGMGGGGGSAGFGGPGGYAQ
jgi:uncharacterized membrane protein YgcG